MKVEMRIINVCDLEAGTLTRLLYIQSVDGDGTVSLGVFSREQLMLIIRFLRVRLDKNGADRLQFFLNQL